MARYDYQHPVTGEVKEIVQGMNDPHVYEEDGVQWKRIFQVPQAAIDTKIDPFSAKDFARNTNKSGGTYGEILDRSREMSQRRADKEGRDPIRERALQEYAATRPAVRQKLKGSNLA